METIQKGLSKLRSISKAVTQRCSVKKLSSLQLCLKRGSGANAFLWILKNFEEHLRWLLLVYKCFLSRKKKWNNLNGIHHPPKTFHYCFKLSSRWFCFLIKRRVRKMPSNKPFIIHPSINPWSINKYNGFTLQIFS